MKAYADPTIETLGTVTELTAQRSTSVAAAETLLFRTFWKTGLLRPRPVLTR